MQVVGDYGFQFCMEELPVAVMYNIPFVCIILNNGYLGLIRQAEKYNFDMDYEVQIWYDSLMASESAQIPKAVTGGKGGELRTQTVSLCSPKMKAAVLIS